MENVFGARHHGSIPAAWHPVVLRDWDCGGETHRKRIIWTAPFEITRPPHREGTPSLSVMASTARRGRTSAYANDKRFLPGYFPIEEYERLQGFPGITAALRRASASKRVCVHLIGNGVPHAMGKLIAEAAKNFQ